MRVYLPASISDLALPLPPISSGVVALPPRGAGNEDVEVLEDDAISQAALASLETTREEKGSIPARVVLAVDTPTEGTVTPGEELLDGIYAAPSFEYTWGDVAAILADLPDAADLVRAVWAATTQDEADEAVASLWEESLAWFDTSERPALVAMHRH